MPIPVNLVFEDELSEYALTMLLNCFPGKYQIYSSYNGRGSGYIKSRINSFNHACSVTPYLVLTDLDNYSCPVELINEWFTNPPHPDMIFRIAVREVEAWLLADIEGYAEFTGIAKNNFPLNPELENDPKNTLINLTKKSRKRSLREDIIPLNKNAAIGPNYNGRLMEFVFDYWNIKRAMKRSESLRRAYGRLSTFQPAK